MACPLVISTTAREASCGTNLELHLRRLGSGRSGVEVGVTRRKSAPRSDQTAGKLPDLRVVRLHSFVVPLPLDGNPVLGSGQFELQIAEVLAGLKIRILLGDNEQPR